MTAVAGHVGPALLGAASLAIGLLILRHLPRVDRARASPWRVFAVLAGLLFLGQSIAACGGRA